MKDVLQKLEKKEDLQLATTRNCRVLSGIKRLLGMIEDSDEESKTRALNLFSLHLMEKLQAIVEAAILSKKLRKGAMYRSYHEFVTGSLYEVWETLERQLHETFDPSLPQVIADTYLHIAINEVSDTLPSPCTTTVTRQLSEIEENAIMFAAGYVVRILLQKYKKSSQPLSAEFVSCLMHMVEGSPLDIQDDESFENCAARWVNISNRGGLLILRRGAYWLFRDVELLLWPFLEKLNTREACLDNKMAIECIVADESIQFTWSMMDVDISKPSDSVLLLTEIVQKWINLRGFSYASSILEAYKRAKGRAIAKEKGLRKGLQSSNTE